MIFYMVPPLSQRQPADPDVNPLTVPLSPA